MALTICFQICKWVNLLYSTSRIDLKKSDKWKAVCKNPDWTYSEWDSCWAFFLWEELRNLLVVCIHVSMDMGFTDLFPKCLMFILNISVIYELLGFMVKCQWFDWWEDIMIMVWKEATPGIWHCDIFLNLVVIMTKFSLCSTVWSGQGEVFVPYHRWGKKKNRLSFCSDHQAKDCSKNKCPRSL